MWKAILLIGFCLISNSGFAGVLSSKELIDQAKQYDNQKVVYSGEVIGDVMRRGKNAWINVNDGIAAVGIWADQTGVKNITVTGSYKAQGDTIEIEGVFHRACLEHGGDLDIHAETIRTITPGQIIFEPIDVKKKKAAVFLGAFACMLWIGARILSQVKKKRTDDR